MLHYQAKMDSASGVVIGAEALDPLDAPDEGPGTARSVHPDRRAERPNRPDRPMAPPGGLPSNARVARRRDVHPEHRGQRLRGRPARPGFADHVFDVLDATRPEAEYLDLELTEAVLMKHIDQTAAVLQRLRERGGQVSLDDFGTA